MAKKTSKTNTIRDGDVTVKITVTDKNNVSKRTKSTAKKRKKRRKRSSSIFD